MRTAWKLSGAGNDFVALVEPEVDPTAPEIAAWCRRGLSLGADGLFTLRRAPDGARMAYWNADGRPAELCLNGTRCAARLAFELGWAGAGDDELRLETGAGRVLARRHPTDRSAIVLDLPAPTELPQRVAPEIDGVIHEGWFLAVGVPHLVLLWPGALERAPLAALGPALRAHPRFAAGTNVNFVRFPARDRMEIRTYERGVEAETLACGSGTLAAAAVGLHLGLADLPLTALTAGGFTLTVGDGWRDGHPTRWTLAGDARLVARLELTPEAAAVPPPPSWSA